MKRWRWAALAFCLVVLLNPVFLPYFALFNAAFSPNATTLVTPASFTLHNIVFVFTELSSTQLALKNTVILGTNRIPFPIAPTVVGTPTATSSATQTLVSVTCAPDVRPGQTTSLALGSNSSPANAFDTQTNSLTFQFPTLSGNYLIRLRVDAVDSPVGVNWNATPPAFTGPFVTI